MRKSNSTTRQRPLKNQLRIIGGQWRGRKLAIADVDGLRPTGDRIRETLFNWLMPDIQNSRCLDMFSGSGALGLECLSRGASEVVLLEKHPQAAEQLRQHCHTLDASNGKVIECDSIDWLSADHQAPSSIDLVFIDPPFAANLWAKAIEQLENSGLLNNDALIYIESPKDTFIKTPFHWQIHKEKQSGQVCYRLFRYTSTDVSVT